ncbi:MAG: WGxxGxxG-CTERM domain-containing protein [Pseudomonadota bacterium]|nr:WGxxGxxG-CTERM domain-containing protein [Pseudomonadota bacterium]
MTFRLKTRHALLAAALITAPGAALAQNNVEAQANQVAAEAQDLTQASNDLSTTLDQQAAEEAAIADGEDRDRERDRDDDDFPWGLLGLLGLAGLLGMKRRDDDHRRVDRTDYDRTAGTRTGTTTGGTDGRL